MAAAAAAAGPSSWAASSSFCVVAVASPCAHPGLVSTGAGRRTSPLRGLPRALVLRCTQAQAAASLPPPPSAACLRETTRARRRRWLIRRHSSPARCCCLSLGEQIQSGCHQSILLASLDTPYNKIRVVREQESEEEGEGEGDGMGVGVTATTHLFLDESGKTHSVYTPSEVFTGHYWDALAAATPLIPDGPIGFLGLAAGTTARVVNAVWPARKLVGYEIDEGVVQVARQFFGLSTLEANNSLAIHVEDALTDFTTVDDGFALLVVDLYSGGEVLPELTEEHTWQRIRSKLRPNGRVIANLGSNGSYDDTIIQSQDARLALGAITRAFHTEGVLKSVVATEFTANVLALTGALPDEEWWKGQLPAQLRRYACGWQVIHLMP